MKYGVIDIGSNSVRLMISVDGQTIKKYVKTTRLAENMEADNNLQAISIERTACAVSFFVNLAKEQCSDIIYIFATAAVRQAKNKEVFLSKVKELTGRDVDVIDGQFEAKLGAIGALNGKDGGIIDVGGASSEVLIIKDGQIVYSKSLNIGAVKLFNLCGQDKEKILEFVKNAVKEYGEIPPTTFYGIGGTATSLASMDLELVDYDVKLVHGHTISLEKLLRLRDKLLDMSLEEKRCLIGLQKERAEVIAGGVALIYEILNCANAQNIIISESDNLEGYLETKRS